MITITFIILLALTLDAWLGEPRRWHPLSGFGQGALWLEKRLRNSSQFAKFQRRNGVWAWLLMIVPLVMALYFLDTWLEQTQWLVWWVLQAVGLYLVIGWRSLNEHAEAVAQPLHQQDINAARQAVSRIVSRDTEHLDEAGISRAVLESYLENGNDAVIAPLFWFVIAGLPGALLYRLANTLDAMWGYRNANYLHFGWWSARSDDVLNWIPARLTALGYALAGQTRQGLQAWQSQAADCASPNGGPVMCAGAGALSIQLGGPAIYHGQAQPRALMGMGSAPTAEDIGRAQRLLRRCILGWWCCLMLISVGVWFVDFA